MYDGIRGRHGREWRCIETVTTDAKLIRACQNTALHMRVMNPVSYLAEMIEDDGY